MKDEKTIYDERIAGIIADYRPDQYDDLISDEDAWPYFYHLSTLRRGLLNWYPFRPDWRLLEVGGGFGALTGALAETAAAVDVIEKDPLRAASLRKRYENNDRIRVIEGDALHLLADHSLDSYDCIVLIDLLDGCAEMRGTLLAACAGALKPDGHLLCGYRNRFGIKYLCGGTDAVQEEPFENLSSEKNVLLTRSQLDLLAKEAGLFPVRYYYPLPDQVFPQAVYTDSVQEIGSVRDRVFAFDPFHSPRIADEQGLIDTLIHEGMLPQTASYYLADFQKEGTVSEEPQVKFAILSTDRGPKCGWATVCYDDGFVEKKPLWREGIPGLKKAFDNLEGLSRRGLCTMPQEWKEDAIRMPQIREKSLLAEIERRMSAGPEPVLEIFDRLWEDILASSEPGKLEEGVCWRDWKISPDKAGPVLAEGLIDMIPYNAFWADGRIRYYDQEFCVENCPAAYIMFRAIFYSWIHIPALEKVITQKEMKERFGLRETWEAYRRREERFVDGNRNRDRYKQVYRWAYQAASPARIRKSVKALTMSVRQNQEKALMDQVHQVQLGLLQELDRVCKEHGLTWFAIHGTLLGAVRHGGFIPWDDDMDIAMPREDYDRLLELAPAAFRKPCFLQTPENEDDCFYGGYAKLRNSNTTAIEPQNRGKYCNQGIWIDILPLDVCPAGERARNRLQKKITRWQRFLYAKIYRPGAGVLDDVDPKWLSLYYLTAGCLRRKWILRRLDKLFHSCGQIGYCAVLACYYGKRENHNVYTEESLSETLELPFEDGFIPVPAGYDSILYDRYGSRYMDIPANEKRYRHRNVIFSADHSWREEEKYE